MYCISIFSISPKNIKNLVRSPPSAITKWINSRPYSRNQTGSKLQCFWTNSFRKTPDCRTTISGGWNKLRCVSIFGIFQAPVPPDSWEGVLDTVKYDKVCFAVSGDSDLQTEDCLYLNVYTPIVNMEKNSINRRYKRCVFRFLVTIRRRKKL